ncbi:hypothetical protein BKA70DRAFT_1141133 [Coprinopsis sp. MPI-PUGE-AT-0042]|nr:hypothetical protein BKA70DRAFT_1141133 [Coprinopsis sp. MPI-PUGE-AT-0042]
MPSLLVPASQLPPHFHLQSTSIVTELQLYAVEKWLVDRARHTPLLLVYTGDPLHTVPLDELQTDDRNAWDTLIHLYRRDGAKPKDTPNGVLMLTSLAHFRSDWSIVNIPNGNFAAAKLKLYANINLLRMGCSGRTALSLDDPSDTTKDRFISLYHLPETTFSPQPHDAKRIPTVRGKTKDTGTFVHTVLELVKVIQAGLSIFGYYTSPLDGLLCDSTLDAITRWMADIGEPLLGLDPSERVVDPVFISALLSLVLAVRNKLAVLVSLDFNPNSSLPSSIQPPKDPFLFPQAFGSSLACWLTATNSPFAGSATLTPNIIEAIDAAYDSATRKRLKPVRKVLRTKLDDLPKVDSDGDERNYRSAGEDVLTSPTGPSSATSSRLLSFVPSTTTTATSTSGGLSSLTSTTVDLASFLTLALSKEKDAQSTSFTGLHVRAHAQTRLDRNKRRTIGGSASISLPQGHEFAPSTSTASPSSSLRNIAKTRESVDLGHFYASNTTQAGFDSQFSYFLDTVVAGSVKALWSGRVAELVRVRECAASLDSPTGVVPLPAPLSSEVSAASSSWSRARSRRRDHKASSSISVASPSPGRNVHSDNDLHPLKSDTDEDSEGIYAPNTANASFGSLLGGKVKGKLGNWTALTKRRNKGGQSVDLSSSVSPPGGSPMTSPRDREDALREEDERMFGSSVIYQEPIAEDEGVTKKPKSKGIHLTIPSPSLRPKLSRMKTAPSGRDRSGSLLSIMSGGGNASTSGTTGGGGPQSPTLPPLIFAGGDHPVGDDEGELLSSGQISPISDYRPSHFAFLKGKSKSGSLSVPMGQSLASSTSNLLPSISNTAVNDTASTLHSKLQLLTSQQQQQQKRRESMKALGQGRKPTTVRERRLTAPSALPRITSWSDPKSARELGVGLGSFSSGLDRPPLPQDIGGGDQTHSEESDDEADEDEGQDMFGPLESDDPTPLPRTARPFSSTPTRGATVPKPVPRRPKLRRRHMTSSALGGSDGEMFVAHRKTRFQTLMSGVGVDGDGLAALNEDEGYLEYDFSGDEVGEGDGWMRRHRSLKRRGHHAVGSGAPLMRRRSYQDLDDLRGTNVLTVERMRIDVEICGQVLVMLRREEHLRNVIACLKILNSNLDQTNTLLREDYEANLTPLISLNTDTKVISALDVQSAQAEQLSQSTNVLRYEAEQFRVPDLWHAVSLSRQKVLAMRQKVFGDGLALATGGAASAIRKVPEGVHGAHGRFNRVQRTLGGEQRVVDSLGRTEEEVEEEEALLVASLQGLVAHKKRQQEQEVQEQSEAEGMGTFSRKKRLDVDLVKREDMIAGTLGAAQAAAELDEGIARDVATATSAARTGGEEEEPVEHSSIRPMWLLRFFMGWGARWSVRAATIPPAGDGASDVKSPPETAPTSPFSLATPLRGKEEGVFVDSPSTSTPSILVSMAESELDESRKDR